VPADVREGISFHFVERMDEVIRLALFNGASGEPAAGSRPARQRGARAAQRKDA
jgi:hypothetical protein